MVRIPDSDPSDAGTAPLGGKNPGGGGERRRYPRVKLRSIAYVELGSGNGGFILDLSEGGLAVQAAIEVVEDSLPLSFPLGPSNTRVEARGQIVWKSASRKMARLEFVDLPEEARAQIREWGKLNQGTPNASAAVTGITPTAALLPQNAGGRVGRIAQARPETRRNANVQPALQGGTPFKPPREPHGNDAGTRVQRVRMLLKRFLVSERGRIRLHDLVSQETEKLCDALIQTEFSESAPFTDEEWARRIHYYEGESETLVTIMTIGCFWGEKEHQSLWAKLPQRVASAIWRREGPGLWNQVRSYPALLLLYAGGLAAVAKGEYSTLAALLFEPRVTDSESEEATQRFNASALLEAKMAGELLAGGQGEARVSVQLNSYLRKPLREFVHLTSEYEELFERFEYLLALTWTDENPQSIRLDWVPLAIPLGRFAYEPAPFANGKARVKDIITAEISQHGRDWPPLRGGLFGRSMQRLLAAKKRVDDLVTLRHTAPFGFEAEQNTADDLCEEESDEELEY
jgi:hypothetical protein